MRLYLLQAESLLWIKREDVSDQVAHFMRQMVWKLQVDLTDSLISFVIVLSLKWWKATAKLETQNAQAPDVDSLIVRLFDDHLGWQVIESATKCLSAVVR